MLFPSSLQGGQLVVISSHCIRLFSRIVCIFMIVTCVHILCILSRKYCWGGSSASLGCGLASLIWTNHVLGLLPYAWLVNVVSLLHHCIYMAVYLVITSCLGDVFFSRKNKLNKLYRRSITSEIGGQEGFWSPTVIYLCCIQDFDIITDCLVC